MKMISLLTILTILLFTGDIRPQEPALSFDLKSEIVNPKHYIVTKNDREIVIDGIASESAWRRAEFSDLFIDIQGVKVPKYDTKMKMLWDEDYLYVFAYMEEPHVWGDLKERDSVIFYNNDFEVFLSPGGTTRNYGEIEINALGTVWDLLLDKPYRDHGKANNHWNLDGLRSAVYIKGTLNDPGDIDSFWSVEMAIPMKALTELKPKPQSIPVEGEQWKVNFSRVEWDHDIVNGVYQRQKDKDGKYRKEYNWVWSNQNVKNMHEPEKWGTIQFTKKTSSRNVSFIKDKHSLIKQVAYALFRRTRRGSLRSLLKTDVGYTRTVRVRLGSKDYTTAIFYRTNFGFEYKVRVPRSDQFFVINEAGALKLAG
jgi:hypothetical protein